MKLKVGDNVKIIGTGNGSCYGTSNTAYGIGWTRQILRIWNGKKYPYQVGNKTGTTGFYQSSSLQKNNYIGGNNLWKKQFYRLCKL